MDNKKYTQGLSVVAWVIIAVIVVIILGIGAYYYFGKPAPQVVGTNIISAEEFCKGAGDFASPNFMVAICVSAVALNNNDASICDKIFSSRKDFMTGCQKTIQDAKLIYQKSISVADSVSAVQQSEHDGCKAEVEKQNLLFVELGNQVDPHSSNGYLTFADGKTTGIASCYGFTLQP